MTARMSPRLAAILAIAATLPGSPSGGGELARGKPDIKTASSLAFGPGGLLFVGDNDGAAVFAIETGDKQFDLDPKPYELLDVVPKVAELVGAGPREIHVEDMVVNPGTGRAYLSFSRGKKGQSTPVIARFDRAGKVEIVDLDDARFAKVALPNPPAPGDAPPGGMEFRSKTVTALAYRDGKVYVAGLSNRKFSSRVIAIDYPFGAAGDGTSVEIYSANRGEIQARSPIFEIAFCDVGGEPNLLTAHGQLPIARFPLRDLKPGAHVRGTTVADLGPRNMPISMIVYDDGGEDAILIATSSGLFKIDTKEIANTSITEQVFGASGLARTKVPLGGVSKISPTRAGRALMVRDRPRGEMDLMEVPLP